jgi:hypothetical protein
MVASGPLVKTSGRGRTIIMNGASMHGIPAAKARYLAVFLSSWLAAGAAAGSDGVVELAGPAGAYTTVSKVAGDGTVVGVGDIGGGYHVLRWIPGQPVEDLGGNVYVASRRVLVSTDGSTVASWQNFSSGARPAFWSGGTTWTPIVGTIMANSTPYAMSRNGLHLAGEVLSGFSIFAWKWSAQTGQVQLPEVPGLSNAIAHAISNDGTVAVGAAGGALSSAVIWDAAGGHVLTDAGGQPLAATATACNSDCSIVAGGNSPLGGSANDPTQAWRWTAQGGAQFLGVVPGAPAGAYYVVHGITEDGSTIVGYWWARARAADGAKRGGQIISQGFVWTARNGAVAIGDFLLTNGITYGRDFPGLVAVAISPDGRLLLMTGGGAPGALATLVTDRIFANGFEP